MSSDIVKRFDRIIAIFIHLQSRRTVRAQDLADRFEVSLRTIYRDIKSLEQAGIPIYSEAGTGYELMEGYKLPPVMFSQEEALSFIAAEKLMDRFIDEGLKQNFLSATYKIKSVLRMSEKDLLSTLENQIIIQKPPHSTLVKKAPDHTMETLFNAIAQQKQVRIDYKGVQDSKCQERIIEPVGLFYEQGYWYIQAYCLLRNDYRQFRTDRISGIQILEIGFSKKHPHLKQLLPEKKNDHKGTEAIIRVHNSFAGYMKWDRHYYGFVSEKDLGEETEMVFSIRDIDNGFPRWLLMFGDRLTIIKPESLKNDVQDLLETQLERIKNSGQ
ncbi:helix-turn-helix transcriptional regulator [Elizabethkingia anophelis]|uniref:helix-turn-helix transcriptional regulator n=1 Tax=Elizabethkingia anophelis TaxID=1117645 RepID=UPI00293C4BC3|nr:transcriptional regulator [Elizabethkingia anophelis]